MTTVVIVSNDGDVYEWDLGVEKWIDAACAMAGRNLDEREWREAFPDRPYRETTCSGRPADVRRRDRGVHLGAERLTDRSGRGRSRIC